MRKNSYVGALMAQRGYLMLITLRHAEEVIPTSQLDPPQGRPMTSKERAMAEQLIGALSGQFRPETYHDEYEERIRELIAARRVGKIDLDYLRNENGATAVASYSTRVRSGATVATPVSWDEVSDTLRPGQFNTQTVPERLGKLTQDPWYRFFRDPSGAHKGHAGANR
jgi:DNA primase